MNSLSQNFKKRTEEENQAEIENLASQQNVKPFDFTAATEDNRSEWTADDEQNFTEFLNWRREIRQAEREAQKNEWQS